MEQKTKDRDLFLSRLAGVNNDLDTPYSTLLAELLERARTYFFTQEWQCRIYGTFDGTFERYVPYADVKDQCQEIWDHPERYSTYTAGSEEAYTKFLKYLWVEFPDKRDQQLASVIQLKPYGGTNGTKKTTT